MQLLSHLGVTHVLNCAAADCDVSNLLPPEWPVRGLRARDAAGYDIVGGHLEEAAAFIDEALASSPGAVVLVHCRHGQNRSAAIAVAYLVHRRHISLSAALARAHDLRPCILTNESFIEQLVQLAAQKEQLTS